MSDLHTLADVRTVAERLWPESTAEAWDRVGLVTGDNSAPIRTILLAVDAVRATVDEAVQLGADLLVTHHPLMLRGVHTMATDTAKGALVVDLIRAECALLAAHTNADTPEGGVSDRIAHLLGLEYSAPIVPGAKLVDGLGRVGNLTQPMTLRALAERLAELLPKTETGVRVGGAPERLVQRVALCGGAGDSLLDHPAVRGADVYITSDLRHHPAQESLEQSLVTGGPALIDIAHWASESLWLEGAASQLRAELSGVQVVVSKINTDPWQLRVG
ncbi:Nif3-like dinuclear metal center hexameric protein [Leucobacter sp. UCMA 4100]|uniref:Nif3-like dinuclear metal center hexameric protein n=1 Tax=Leucobacter sp. UCMA 4100 TaxID=2810534 RepID=UPI0022EA8E6B|nr:Nif3-like dinuclear metal center hexameric protein [Leucobacter sp. UCMA 4100]MDA3146108.1 Nif3-like dinuclear metal center hexameric protein [Leucobacter sp. UCMA 4100]